MPRLPQKASDQNGAGLAKLRRTVWLSTASARWMAR